MAGNRSTVARTAREQVQRRIVAWVSAQPGTQQALCRRLRVSASQLHVLVNDGVERCSLEYLLDVWQRCGGAYSLLLSHATVEHAASIESPLSEVRMVQRDRTSLR